LPKFQVGKEHRAFRIILVLNVEPAVDTGGKTIGLVLNQDAVMKANALFMVVAVAVGNRIDVHYLILVALKLRR